MSKIAASALFLGAFVSTAVPAFAQCPPRGGGGNNGRVGIAPPPPAYLGPGDTVSPSSPAAPAPAAPMAPAPVAPRPNAPVTPGGPRGAVTPMAQPRRGAPVSFTHRATTLEALNIEWTYPHFRPVEQEGFTVAPKVYKALPITEAIDALAGTDQRPLLVMRECWICEGTDHALLDSKLANEKTLLMSKWFHCVRLGDSTRHDNHPAHLLFKEHGMPHLLLVSRDGSVAVPMDGRRTQSQLWAGMRKVLKASYERDPDAAVSEIFQVLGQYDHLDSLESEIAARLQDTLNEQSKDSPRVRQLEAERAKVASEREALKKRQADLMDLGVKTPSKASAPKGE